MTEKIISEFTDSNKVVDLSKIGESTEKAKYSQNSPEKATSSTYLDALSKIVAPLLISIVMNSNIENTILPTFLGTYDVDLGFKVLNGITLSNEFKFVRPNNITQNMRIQCFVDLLPYETADFISNPLKGYIRVKKFTSTQSLLTTNFPVEMDSKEIAKKGMPDYFFPSCPAAINVTGKPADSIEIHALYLNETFNYTTIMLQVKILQSYLSGIPLTEVLIEKNNIWQKNELDISIVSLKEMKGLGRDLLTSILSGFNCADIYIYVDEANIKGTIGFCLLALSNVLPVIARINSFVHIDSLIDYSLVRHQGKLVLITTDPDLVKQTLNDVTWSSFTDADFIDAIIQFVVKHIDVSANSSLADKFRLNLHVISNDYSLLKNSVSLPCLKIPNMMGFVKNVRNTSIGISYANIPFHLYEVIRAVVRLSQINILIDIAQDRLTYHASSNVDGTINEEKNRRRAFFECESMFRNSSLLDNIFEKFTSIPSLGMFSMLFNDTYLILHKSTYDTRGSLTNDFITLRKKFTLIGCLNMSCSTRDSIWQFFDGNKQLSFIGGGIQVQTLDLGTKNICELLNTFWVPGERTCLAFQSDRMHVNTEVYNINIPTLVMYSFESLRNIGNISITLNRINLLNTSPMGVNPKRLNVEQGLTLSSFGSVQRTNIQYSTRFINIRDFKSYMNFNFSNLNSLINSKIGSEKIERLFVHLTKFYKNYYILIRKTGNEYEFNVIHGEKEINSLITVSLEKLFSSIFLESEEQIQTSYSISFDSSFSGNLGLEMGVLKQFKNSIIYDDSSLQIKGSSNNEVEKCSDVDDFDTENLELISDHIKEKKRSIENTREIKKASIIEESKDEFMRMFEEGNMPRTNDKSLGEIRNDTTLDKVMMQIYIKTSKNKEPKLWDKQYFIKKYNKKYPKTAILEIPYILTKRFLKEFVTVASVPIFLLIIQNKNYEMESIGVIYPTFVILANLDEGKLSLLEMQDSKIAELNEKWLKRVLNIQINSEYTKRIKLTTACMWLNEYLHKSILSCELHSNFINVMIGKILNNNLDETSINYGKYFNEYTRKLIKKDEKQLEK